MLNSVFLGIMVKNNRRNNIKRDKSNYNSKCKRFNPWFAGAIFSIAASLGVASYYFLNKNEPSIDERVQISFEQAQSNEGLRQIYIEQKSKPSITSLESQYSTKLVDKIVYDPEYKGLDLLINKELADTSNPEEINYWKNSLLQNEDHRSQKDIKCLGKTMILPKKFMHGQPSDLYFSKDCFDPEFVDSEEEFLSLLDHELNHALIINKGLPIKKEFSAKHNLDSSMKLDLGSDLGSSCIEVVAYHFQILLIEDGVRKVRDSYRQRAVNSYYREYEIVRAIADRNDDSVESRFANALLDSLIYHPGPKRK